jgi:hypothetical protein
MYESVSLVDNKTTFYNIYIPYTEDLNGGYGHDVGNAKKN